MRKYHPGLRISVWGLPFSFLPVFYRKLPRYDIFIILKVILVHGKVFFKHFYFMCKSYGHSVCLGESFFIFWFSNTWTYFLEGEGGIKIKLKLRNIPLQEKLNASTFWLLKIQLPSTSLISPSSKLMCKIPLHGFQWQDPGKTTIIKLH